MTSNNISMKALSRPPELTQLKQVSLIKIKKNQDCSDRTVCDLSTIRYYNCQKRGHFANNYLEQKTNLSLDNLFVDG